MKNRPIAAILMLFFFWANAAYGLSNVCVCTTDARGVIDCANDCCGSGQKDSCGHKSASNHEDYGTCLTFGCAHHFKTISLSDLETASPGHLDMFLRAVLPAFRERPHDLSFISGYTHAFYQNPINHLLQTCSLLS